MLSNHSAKSIEKRLEYVRSQIKGTTHPMAIKMINKELAELKAKLEEANNRNVVGRTDNGDLVYTAVNPYGSTSADKVLYIEGLPSGWDAAAFDMSSGVEQGVMIDGGQNWSETIVFD